MRLHLESFGTRGWPLVVTSRVDDMPFFAEPDGVDRFRKAIWDNFKDIKSLDELDRARAEIFFHYLFLKDSDTFGHIEKYGARNDELIAVIRKASAYFKKKFAPPADLAHRPWRLTREQFYTLPHTVEWAKGKKRQWVKQYTDPSGKFTRNYPDFHERRDIVDDMHRRAKRWAYENNELDD